MDYYFYNTDASSCPKRDRPAFLIENRMAVTGGAYRFGEQLRQLAPDNRLLMYENGVGVVAVGEVLEYWDKVSHSPPIYYNTAPWSTEPEYRIAVDWFLDLREDPVGIHELRERAGGPPRGTVRPIKTHRAEVEKIIQDRTFLLPQELANSAAIPEGAKRKVLVNAYERNPLARRKCIEHWGYKCSVCGRSLEDIYGPAAAGIIHVHHLIPLSEISHEYEVDPIEDLLPVCPNCHAVIHRDPNHAFTIEDVKAMLKVSTP